MAQFSTDRFLSVGRWDLAVNRQFYARAALIILVVMALPTLTSLAGDLWMPYADSTTLTAILALHTINNYLLMLPFLLGYTLHNMASRQGRISELTLPASSHEKFLWHTCLVLLGSLAVAVACFLLLDAVHFLAVWLTIGLDHACGFIASLHRLAVRLDEGGLFGFLGVDTRFGIIRTLAYVLFASTFVLGNALRYKQNIALTIAWDMALSLVAVIVMTAALTMRIRRLLQTTYSDGLHLDDILGTWHIGTTIIVAEVCLIALCWWVAYRLYAKARLTSRAGR